MKHTGVSGVCAWCEFRDGDVNRNGVAGWRGVQVTGPPVTGHTANTSPLALVIDKYGIKRFSDKDLARI